MADGIGLYDVAALDKITALYTLSDYELLPTAAQLLSVLWTCYFNSEYFARGMVRRHSQFAGCPSV